MAEGAAQQEEEESKTTNQPQQKAPSKLSEPVPMKGQKQEALQPEVTEPNEKQLKQMKIVDARRQEYIHAATWTMQVVSFLLFRSDSVAGEAQ